MNQGKLNKTFIESLLKEVMPAVKANNGDDLNYEFEQNNAFFESVYDHLENALFEYMQDNLEYVGDSKDLEHHIDRAIQRTNDLKNL